MKIYWFAKDADVQSYVGELFCLEKYAFSCVTYFSYRNCRFVIHTL